MELKKKIGSYKYSTYQELECGEGHTLKGIINELLKSANETQLNTIYLFIQHLLS